MSPVLEMVNTSEEIVSLPMDATEGIHGSLAPTMWISDIADAALAVCGLPTHAAVHCAVAAAQAL